MEGICIAVYGLYSVILCRHCKIQLNHAQALLSIMRETSSICSIKLLWPMISSQVLLVTSCVVCKILVCVSKGLLALRIFCNFVLQFLFGESQPAAIIVEPRTVHSPWN